MPPPPIHIIGDVAPLRYNMDPQYYLLSGERIPVRKDSQKILVFCMLDVFCLRHWRGEILGAFAKLRKATQPRHVCPFAWNNSAPTGWIFTKFDT